MLKKLAFHTSIYSIGSLLGALSGFISFPIITRYLSVEDYGYLNLVSVALAVLVGLSKAGLQKSVVRFFGEVKQGKSPFSMTELYATSLLGMCLTGFVVSIIWLCICLYYPRTVDTNELFYLFTITAILILTRTLYSACQNFFVANNQSIVTVTSNLLNRYTSLLAVIVTLVYVSQAVVHYYMAIILVEIIVLFFFIYYTTREQSFRIDDFNPTLYKAMLIYGTPLVGLEISSQLLSLADRYILQFYHGTEQTGVYSAAYNLCEYLNSIVLMSISTAIMPVYMELWAKKGERATSTFISQALYYYVFFTIPIIFGFSMIGEDFIVIMASEKYQSSAVIIPYVISGMLLNGAMSVFAAGLYIKKKTLLLMSLMLSAAIFNIVLNFFLIPTWGIMGAAWATLASYLALAAFAYVLADVELQVKIPWLGLFHSALISCAMVYAMSLIAMEQRLLQLGVQVIVGIGVFVVLTLLSNPTIRTAVSGVIKRKAA